MGLFRIHSQALVAVNNRILEDVVATVFIHDFSEDLLRISFMVLISGNFADLPVLFDHLLLFLVLLIFLGLDSVHNLKFDSNTPMGRCELALIRLHDLHKKTCG